MKTLSVLIPTLGREKELIATVQGLLAQTVLPLEIVVVDQNTPSIPAVDRYLASVPLVRHIHAPVKGVTINYNRCLQEARGDIVLYVDDDVVPRPQLIERHLRAYEVEGVPPVGGVAGRVLQQEGTIDPALIRKVGTYLRWRGAAVANFNALNPTEVQFAQGANMSFRRDVLARVGGFDQGFDGNGYFFETDGGLRVIQSGYRIVFEPQAELLHLMASSGGARLKDKSRHTYYFVKNGIRLYRRHSPRIGLPFFVIWMGAYVKLKAAYNLQPSILKQGLRAIYDGLKQPLAQVSSDG